MNNGAAVAFVDLETLRGITYPDVLVHLLVAILAALRSRVKDVSSWKRPTQKVRLIVVRRRLRTLERNPCEASGGTPGRS